MNADSKVMKQDMLKAAEGRLARQFPLLSKAARRSQAPRKGGRYVRWWRKIRKDVR